VQDLPPQMTRRRHQGDMRGNPWNASLLPELRKALQHLYDQVELRQSTLVELLDVDHRKEPALALRRLLVEAIGALKPDASVPPQANAWRTYQILTGRFIEQLTQKEVATDLGLSIRQAQRQERRALRALAEYLSSRYNLPAALTQAPEWGNRGQAPIPPQPSQGDSSARAAPTRERELEWLRESVPSEPADVAELIQSALQVANTLAQTLEVHVECVLLEALPPLAVQRDPIRQALLILLTAAIHSVPGGQVRVEAQVHRWGDCISIRAVRRRVSPSIPAGVPLGDLQVARQLAALSGGSLELTADDHDEEPFIARLTLPAVEQVPVLTVDDNADTLQLFQRYLAGSRYRFIGARDPKQALASIEYQIPQLIVLDVMMPGIDGWELLGRLRAHPKTRDVPIIVCTILPQEKLALSLGAAAFLGKPVSQEGLLTALDQQLALQSREPH